MDILAETVVLDMLIYEFRLDLVISIVGSAG